MNPAPLMNLNEFAACMRELQEAAERFCPGKQARLLAGPDGVHSVVALTCGRTVWIQRDQTQATALHGLQEQLASGDSFYRMILDAEPKSLEEAMNGCAGAFLDLMKHPAVYGYSKRLSEMIAYVDKVTADPRAYETANFQTVCVSGWLDWTSSHLDQDLWFVMRYLAVVKRFIVAPFVSKNDRAAVFSLTPASIPVEPG